MAERVARRLTVNEYEDEFCFSPFMDRYHMAEHVAQRPTVNEYEDEICL